MISGWLYECSNVWTSQIHEWILFPLSLSDFNTSGWIGWWESHRWLTFWRSNWNYSNFDNHLWDPNFELVRKRWQLLKMYIANSCRRVQGAMLYSCKLDVFFFFFASHLGYPNNLFTNAIIHWNLTSIVGNVPLYRRVDSQFALVEEWTKGRKEFSVIFNKKSSMCQSVFLNQQEAMKCRKAFHI